MRNFRSVFGLALIAMLVVIPAAVAAEGGSHVSGKFAGPKANTGTVMHFTEGGKSILKLSDDFVVPDTPDPHWQVIDSKGNVYLLSRMPIKDGKVNRQIVLPKYIRDIAKVQVWCAFAETNLGEASFSSPVK